jgi:poly(3-hydroxybutyrate) depolymerase
LTPAIETRSMRRLQLEERTMRAIATFLFLLTAILAPLPAMAEVPAGRSSFEMDERFGRRHTPMKVHLYRPASWSPADRVLFVMHGRQRNAAEYRDEWVHQAEAGKLLIVVPEFDTENFPGTAAYNWGSVVDRKRNPQPAEAWAFGIIDKIHAEIRRRTGATRERYSLYGHSAGAQFTHRFLLLAKAANADLIITANAGSYTMPVRDIAFPFGLGGVTVDDADLRRAFARTVIVLLGDRDIDPDHPSLPRQDGAMAQGPHRFARGELFFNTARARAAELGAPFNWRLVPVPGVGHVNAGMADMAATIFAKDGN